MSTKKFVLVLRVIVISEYTLAACVLVIFYRQILYKNVLGLTSVVRMRSEDYKYTNTDNIKGYFEPLENHVTEDRVAWLTYVPKYTINTDTLNERYEYTMVKPSDTFRIIALGDSFTFGQYVDTKYAWSEQLEDMLNSSCTKYGKYEVLNLGVGGYDVQFISQRFKLRGKKYNPDLIIWYESGSGFDRMEVRMRGYVRKYDTQLSAEQREAYKAKGDYYPSWTLARNELITHYGRKNMDREIGGWWKDFLQYRDQTPVMIVSERLSRENESRLIHWTENQANVKIYSNVPNLRNSSGVLLDNHPNIQGHTLIAQTILSNMSQKNDFRFCEL